MRQDHLMQFAQQTIACISQHDTTTGEVPRQALVDLQKIYEGLGESTKTDAREWVQRCMKIATLEMNLPGARAWLQMKETIEPSPAPIDYRQAFIELYKDIVACEPPEESQLGEVLENHYTVFQLAKEQ